MYPLISFCFNCGKLPSRTLRTHGFFGTHRMVAGGSRGQDMVQVYHPTSSCLGQSTGQMDGTSEGLGWVGWLVDVTKKTN